VSHLSAIGFPFKQPEELLRFVASVVNEGEALSTPKGYYVFWSPGEGVEFWIRVDDKRRIVGCSPHFTGSGQMRVGITQTFRNEERMLDGSCYAWADPQDDNPYSGLYPFVADMPDFDLVEERALLTPIVTLQIAAFSTEARCFRSEGEFITAQPDGSRPVTESVTPTWQHGDHPSPDAHINGRIQQVELRANPATGQEFYALGVKTHGGTIDVVADPELLRGKPAENGVIQGTFWLSTRIVSDLPIPKQPRFPYRRRR
jgi:hypothetical protein